MTAKTEIRFRRGIDAVTMIPEEARANGFTERAAVIQESFRPDKVDMFFDEALFVRLLDYAREVADEGTVEVLEACPATGPKAFLARFLGQDRWTWQTRKLDAFLKDWLQIPSDEREPPAKVLVLEGGSPILCMTTEFWTRVGGPPEYHDSYTYSLFSREDRLDELFEFLAASPDAETWTLVRSA